MLSSNYKDNVYQMQINRFKAFKAQDHEKGQFDVKFVIQGRTLYANKVFLTTVSDPMAAMLSDRWSTKDEPVKIETYTYDCFYQFLCFIYIGGCKLTNDNIREMVDLAEFYGVPCHKDYCDRFLSRKQDFTPENIEEWYDFAQQYSLSVFTKSIQKYIKEKGDVIILENIFSSFKKPFVQFFSAALKGNFKEEFFEVVCNWIEHHAEKVPDGNDSNINLQDVVKAEINDLIPNPDFYRMNFQFLMDFVVEHGFFVSPSKYFFVQKTNSTNGGRIEAPFKWAYELSEKQALKKQSIAAKNGENFDVAASIQSDLAEIMPDVKFHEMDKQFLIDFVAEKGFILSPTELCESFNMHCSNPGHYFKLIYELAEKQALQKQKMSSDPDNFSIDDSIKNDLAEVMPHVKFYLMDKQFLMDFVLEKGFVLSAADLLMFFKNLGSEYSRYSYFTANYQNAFKNTYELAEKQALKKQSVSVENGESFNIFNSIKADLSEVLLIVQFHNMDKKFLMDFVFEKGFAFSAADLLIFFENLRFESEQKRFNATYELAEKQALKKKMIADQNGESFNLVDSIKAELIEVIPNVKFYKMDKHFLLDFVLEKGFLLSPTKFIKFFKRQSEMSEQQKLESVYEIVVKQASKKQLISSDGDNFNLTDSIKADLAEVIPFTKFYHFDKQFLTDFVVANGILSEEQASHVFDTRVVVENGDQTITGFFVDDYGIRCKFESDHGSNTKRSKVKKLRFCKVKISYPSTPSTVTKMKGVKWYLCLEKDGVFAIKYHNLINRSDYLIAQMGNNDEFQLDPEKRTLFTFSYNAPIF